MRGRSVELTEHLQGLVQMSASHVPVKAAKRNEGLRKVEALKLQASWECKVAKREKELLKRLCWEKYAAEIHKS